jgi:hypothetical protein
MRLMWILAAVFAFGIMWRASMQARRMLRLWRTRRLLRAWAREIARQVERDHRQR